MKLHVGCGKRLLPGFVHVDACHYTHIDVVCELANLNQHFKNNSIDEIYACHVLEHISRHEIPTILQMFWHLLKPGGLLRLAVPDLEAICKLYVQKAVPLYPYLYGLLWGGQKNDLDYHYCGFDFHTLHEFLVNAGFTGIQRYNWREFLPASYDDYSMCYLPHMDFENGVLMSLNVLAIKV